MASKAAPGGPGSSPALERMEEAYQRFKCTLTAEDCVNFHSATRREAWEELRKLQRVHGAEVGSSTFINLQSFLSGLEGYSSVIEVLCNGTPYLSFIWVCFNF